MPTSEEMDKRDKTLLFIEHIEQHLREMGIQGKPVCKICRKDIDTIVDECP